ncbi:MAG: nitroreductase family protein [Bacteroidota bacterium]
MNVLNYIADRKSPLAFSHDPVDEELIRLLFTAAGKAPSGFNAQPWHFILTRRGERGYEALLRTLSAANAQWAGDAPLLVLVTTRKIYPGRGENHFASYEAGLAVGNLLVQASAAGLSVHQMGGYDKEAARRLFGIPGEFDLLVLMAIGYHGDPLSLPDDLRERELNSSSRKELGDILTEGIPFS